MCTTPAAAITRNQTVMIGPNKAATRAVPRDCTANSTNEDDDGHRHDDSGRMPASTSFRPSTADSTEIAGVITESP